MAMTEDSRVMPASRWLVADDAVYVGRVFAVSLDRDGGWTVQMTLHLREPDVLFITGTWGVPSARIVLIGSGSPRLRWLRVGCAVRVRIGLRGGVREHRVIMIAATGIKAVLPMEVCGVALSDDQLSVEALLAPRGRPQDQTLYMSTVLTTPPACVVALSRRVTDDVCLRDIDVGEAVDLNVEISPCLDGT